MTTKVFKKKLRKIIEKSDEFVTWDNTDKGFEGMEDDDLVVVGKDHTENFLFRIVKVI